MRGEGAGEGQAGGRNGRLGGDTEKIRWVDRKEGTCMVKDRKAVCCEGRRVVSGSRGSRRGTDGRGEGREGGEGTGDTKITLSR